MIEKEFVTHYKNLVDQKLIEYVQSINAPALLKESMVYSLEAGGKRIRPLLLFATLSAYEKQPELGITVACALEMIHTYSLIHDDLPSMDDDDFRRGKLTNHKVFGEAIAILAGDALLTYSFELITKDPHLSAEDKVWIINLLAQCAGPEGMVGGQVADLQGENKQLTLEEIEYIHAHKTGKLLSFSIMAGAKIAGGNENEINLFRQFSEHLGLAFQISDDILDVIGDQAKLGKPVGSDEDKAKSTYPSLLTLEGAKEQLDYHTSQAKEILQQVKKDTKYLLYLTNLIAGRSY